MFYVTSFFLKSGIVSIVVTQCHIVRHLFDVGNVVLNFDLTTRQLFFRCLTNALFNLRINVSALKLQVGDTLVCFHVQNDLEGIRSIIALLATHDVRRNPSHVVKLGVSSRCQEYFRVHFKCGFGNGTHIVIQQSRTENRYHVLVARHAIT